MNNLEDKEMTCSGKLLDNPKSDDRHEEDVWGNSEFSCFIEGGNGKESTIAKPYYMRFLRISHKVYFIALTKTWEGVGRVVEDLLIEEKGGLSYLGNIIYQSTYCN